MAGASIPKTMVIMPKFEGVTAFVKDANLVSRSVTKMTKDINTSVAALSKTPVGISKTTAGLNNLTGSLTKNLSSLNSWAKGFDLSNNAVARFGAGLSHLSRGITRFSFQMERVGRSMFMAFTLPVLAAAVGVFTASKDFEAALVKVETLVGVNEEVVKGWGEQILDTANDLAILPVDMAKGLFAVASGFGSVAAQAPVMDVLTASVKASVLGLGDVEDVGRAATAMMNAFGKETLTAENSVSLLVLGVREGNLEVNKLATAIGNVLGTAAAVGAGADDVLAFISAYTRFGVDPSRAVTALNTAFTNLIKPSGKSKEILDAWGLSAEEIRRIISGPGGLAQLFVSMRQSMPDEDFIEIFGLRSLRAVLAVTGTEMNQFYKEYIRIADLMQKEGGGIYTAMAMEQEKGSYAYEWYMEMAERVGEKTISTLTEAWIAYADTLEKKFGVIKSQLQSVFIGVGIALEPALKNIADKIIEVLDKINLFVRENKETVKFITKIALALAALGPVLIIVSRITQAFGVLVGIAGAFFSLIGKGVAIVGNFVFHSVRLAIVIGSHVVKAFLLLGVAVFKATVAIVAFAIKTTAAIGYHLAAQIMSLGASFMVLGRQALGAAIIMGGQLVMGFFSAAAAIAPLLAGISGIIIALGAIGATVLLAVGAIGAVFDKIGEIGKGISDFFNKLSGRAATWGEGLTEEYSNGIIRGAVHVIRALTDLGRWIVSFLKPGSPPKILPEIDKWGTQTMQEWIDGWALADFGVFNDITGIIEDFLTSITPKTKDGDEKEGIINSVLGSRGLIAEAINQMRKFGSVSTEALQDIYSAIGTTTLELENYIEAMLVAAGTTQKLADAQQRVNDINEKYSQMLDPIQKKLGAIERERNVIAGDREIALLKRTMERENLPERIKRLAELRMEEINLEVQQEGIEGERDAALEAANEQVKLAKIANDAAIEQMNIAKETLALQTWGADLMQELVDISESSKNALDKIAKGVDSIAGGILEQFTGDAEGGESIWDMIGGDDGEGVFSKLDEEIKGLQEELGTLQEVWIGVFDEVAKKLHIWKIRFEVAIDVFLYKIKWKWKDAWEALTEEGSRTWDHLVEVLQRFWDNTVTLRANIKEWMDGLKSEFKDNLPGAIVAFSDAINGLITALDLFLIWLTSDDKIIPWIAQIGALTAVLGPFGTALGVTVAAIEAWKGLDLSREEDPEDQSWGEWVDEMQLAWGDTVSGFETMSTDLATARDNVGVSIDNFFTTIKQDIADGWDSLKQPDEGVDPAGTIYDPFGSIPEGPAKEGIGTFFTNIGNFIGTAWDNATKPGERPGDTADPLAYLLPDWFTYEGLNDLFAEGGAANTVLSGFYTDLAEFPAKAWENLVMAGEFEGDDTSNPLGFLLPDWFTYEGLTNLLKEGGIIDTAIDGFYTGVEDAIKGGLKTAWENATSQADSGEGGEGPLGSIFEALGIGDKETDNAVENLGKVGKGAGTLGGGFYAVGLNADVAKIAADFLMKKVIELKNNAIETLTTKTETLRAKMEEWRAKMVAVKTWVQNLIDKVTLFITGALTDLSNFLTVTVNVALEDARQLFQDIQEWIDTYTGPAVDALTAAFGFMADAISPLNDLLDIMAGLLETVVGWVAGLPDYIINWFKGGMPSLPPWLRGGDTDTDDDGKSNQQSAIPSHGIELPSPVGFGSDALPGTRGIGAATAGVGTAVSSFSAAIGTATSKARTRTSVAPSVVIGAGSTVATQGGMVMSFGDVIINNDMDMAVFEARVRNAVSNSMIN